MSQRDPQMTKNPIQHLLDAYYAGRPIVPLVGAGISAEAGFPPTSALVRYLAKVRNFLDEQLFLPPGDRGKDRKGGLYHDRKSHLRLVGWPEPFQLNDVLWDWERIEGDPSRMRDAIDRVYHAELQRDNQEVQDRLDVMHELLTRATRREREWFLAASDPVADKDFLRPAQRLGVLKYQILSDFSARGRKELDPAKKKTIEAFLRSPIRQPNWRPFLRQVTDGQADQVDSLFQMLNRGRQPGNSHRFLAFLAKLLGWKLVLTTNFDDLTERAMRSEDLAPMIFDIWHGAELPNDLLLGYGLSIVKLHGGAYGLRVGESLDDPLPPHDRDKLLRYMPDDPLLLVLGNGGQDRRIRDLVEAVIEQPRTFASDAPKVVWVHFSESAPPQVEEWKKKCDNSVVTGRTYDAAAFLIDLYTQITHTHPTGAEAYSAHSQRPLGLTAKDFFGPADPARTTKQDDSTRQPRPIVVFTGEGDGASERHDCPQDASTIAMGEFLSALTPTHTPIWLDAGMFQSVEELVAEIISQCRKHDPTLPSVVLAMGSSDDDRTRLLELSKAIGRVLASLRRGTYALALDEVGSFGRPPTNHHGVPASCEGPALVRVKDLLAFLKSLVERADECGDSRVLLAVNNMGERFAESGETNPEKVRLPKVNKLLREFRRLMEEKSGSDRGLVDFRKVSSRRQHDKPKSDANLTAEQQREEDLKALVVIFRRPRSLVALHKLAIDYFRYPETSEGKVISRAWPNVVFIKRLHLWLERLHGQRFLIPMEGALYWMGSRERDTDYHNFSKLASSIELLDALGAPLVVYHFLGYSQWHTGSRLKPAEILERERAQAGPPPPVPKDAELAAMARQAARLTLQHRDVARYYYSDQFLACKDPSAFFEYLYHRISSIRYGTILAALVERYGDEIRAHRDPARPSVSAPAAADAEDSRFEESCFPDPVGLFLDDHLKKDNNHKSLRDRLDDIRSLRKTLERDRELLMSSVPSDTLCGWIDWIVKRDLARFRLAYYSKGLLTDSVKRKIEDRIEDETCELLRMFQSLLGKVLREKTDYFECIKARIAQVRDLLNDELEPPIPGFEDDSRTDPEQVDVDAMVLLLRSGTIREDGKGKPVDRLLKEFEPKFHRSIDRFLNESESERFKPVDWLLKEFKRNLSRLCQSDQKIERQRGISALTALLDVGNCFTGLGQRIWARDVIDRLRDFIRGLKQGDDGLAENFEILELRIHFRSAVLYLSYQNYWDRKNDRPETEPRKTRWDSLRRQVLEECDAGLNLVRESNTEPDEYFIYRSYLRTQKARALAVSGEFVGALREFDSAKAGLDLRPGAGRNAIAVRTLYFAEALTFYSDFKIMAKCMDSLAKMLKADGGDDEAGTHFPPTVLSPHGKFFCNSEEILNHLDPEGKRLGEAGSPARDLLRRALTPWSHGIKSSPDDVRQQAAAGIAVMRAVEPRLGEDAERATFALGGDLRGAWKESIKPEDREVKIALKRSLAYWHTENLKGMTPPDRTASSRPSTAAAPTANRDDPRSEVRRDVYNALHSAAVTLDRARDELNQAEKLLTGGRRDIQFWYLLHRLRAQIEFEKLLIFMTLGPYGCGLGPYGSEEDVDRRFLAEFNSRTSSGLRCLRDARDNLLARTDLTAPKLDPRLIGLERLRFQFLVVCAVNAYLRPDSGGKTGGAPKAFEDEFWELWNWMNRSAGLADLVTPDLLIPFRTYLRMVFDSAGDLDTYGLPARAFVERHIKLFCDPLPPLKESHPSTGSDAASNPAGDGTCPPRTPVKDGGPSAATGETPASPGTADGVDDSSLGTAEGADPTPASGDAPGPTVEPDPRSPTSPGPVAGGRQSPTPNRGPNGPRTPRPNKKRPNDRS
jgi:hypothetical protein